MIHTKLVSAFVLGAMVFIAACTKNEPAHTTSAPQAQAPAATKDHPRPKPTSDSTATFVATVMKPYEQCRSLLASDKGAGIADCANKMTAAAKADQTNASATAKPHLAAIATAAEALSKTSPTDLDKLRVAYGNVSKPIVALLTAMPEVARDYHVFECPMAKGYKRWAQPDKKLANPYMGQSMLSCGSEVHDHHKGMIDDSHMKGNQGHDMEHR